MDMFTCVKDLASHQPVPDDGILTRTLLDNDHVKVVLFTFAAQQELSEHTASMPASLHFLDGTATVGLGGEMIEAQNGTWVHMTPGLSHSIKAKTPTRMLLTLIKTGPKTDSPAKQP